MAYFHLSFDSVVYVLSFIGIMVFAVSGALTAGKKGFDWLGVLVIATVTAIGGGTLRDLLLGRHPIFWIENPSYLIACFGAAAFAIVYVKLRKPPRTFLLVADALGLALFTITGTQVAADFYLPGLILVLMGTITGVAGGVMRDVLCREVPLLFQRSELYATAAVAGSTTYLLLLNYAGLPRIASALAGVFVIAALRLLAIIWQIKLPVFMIEREQTTYE